MRALSSNGMVANTLATSQRPNRVFGCFFFSSFSTSCRLRSSRVFALARSASALLSFADARALCLSFSTAFSVHLFLLWFGSGPIHSLARKKMTVKSVRHKRNEHTDKRTHTLSCSYARALTKRKKLNVRGRVFSSPVATGGMQESKLLHNHSENTNMYTCTFL